ncbi:MAG: hypothetical protein WCI20_01985 [bacterium]
MTKSNESGKHAGMNARIENVLTPLGWVLRREEKHTDITAFLPGRRGVWALESERRANAYWIKRNAFRNERNGACGIVFATESEAVAEKIRRIVGCLPEILRRKVVVVSIEGFTESFVHNVMERNG